MSKQSILLIDDSESITKSIDFILKRAGYTVFTALSGDEGMEIFKKEKPQLVISDLMMDWINGIEVLKQVKEVEPETLVIILTGYGEMDTAIEALHLGATDYLLKPCNMEVLLHKVNHCFDKLETQIDLLKINEELSQCLISSKKTEEKREQIEEKLLQSEIIVSSSSDLLALLDRDYTYLAANPAYLKMVKKTYDQVIGKKVADVFGEEFFNRVIKPNADLCMRGEEIHYQEWFDFSASGKRYMEINYYPYLNFGEKIKRFVVNGKDITDRKFAEDELIKHRDHLGHLANERQEMNKKLRNLYRRLEKVREDERKHVACEIHDELGQRLSYLQFDLQLLQVDIPDNFSEAHAKMCNWKETIDETIKMIQLLSARLRPPLLDIMGLSEAIKDQCQGVEKRTKIVCNFHSNPKVIKLDADLPIDIYRIAQEAITNCVRHSNPKSISVELLMEDDVIRLEITDDGGGIEEAKISSKTSLGLMGIRERARNWGGTIQIKNRSNENNGNTRGTRVNLHIPLTKSLIK